MTKGFCLKQSDSFHDHVSSLERKCLQKRLRFHSGTFPVRGEDLARIFLRKRAHYCGRAYHSHENSYLSTLLHT